MAEHQEPGTEMDREKGLEALKERQLRELREFEERQQKELEEFERQEEGPNEVEERHHPFEIKIDRTHFKVDEAYLTGAQLRLLPQPPIGPERDLFEVVPGGSDEKIADTQKVKMRDGLRFFTAPAQINPGSV